MNRGDLATPLAVTMAVRTGTRKLPPEVVRAVFVDDTAEGATVAIWRHAALASVVADHGAQLAAVLLASPTILAAALDAVHAGQPLTPARLGLDGDAVLASLGRSIASGVDSSP